MPKLIKLTADGAVLADDRFTHVTDDEGAPEGDIIISLKRFQAEGESLRSNSREVGVRIEPDEEIEVLADELALIPIVAVAFPKFRDGRAFTTATLLRERFGYKGEVRAVGDVLREQAGFQVRCGFDAFEPADGSTPEQWAQAIHRHRHVYQRAADHRSPAFEERAGVVEGKSNAI
jgi:uncharacterized protein (DUF934 family)